MIYPRLRPRHGQHSASARKPELSTRIQVDLVRRHEAVHVVQFIDCIVKELQDQCHAIISLDERMDVRLEKTVTVAVMGHDKN